MSLVCTKASRGDESKVIEGVRLIRVKVPKIGLISGDCYYLKGLGGEEPDIVHSVTAIEPVLHNRNVLLHLQNDITLYLPPFPKTNVYSRFLNRANALVGVSGYVLSRCLGRLDLTDSKKMILHNCADIDTFTPRKRDRAFLKDRFGFDENEIVVMYSGHMSKKKGLHLLLEANRKKDLGISILVAGGDFYTKKKPRTSRYMDMVTKEMERASNVKYVGPVGMNELSTLYASSDIMIVPSIWDDPCPLVLAEAAASGLPTIGTSRGGIPEVIIEGRTGYVVKKTPGSMANAIGKLVSDDKLRRSMSLSARRNAIKNLNWGVAARKLDALYKKIA